MIAHTSAKLGDIARDRDTSPPQQHNPASVAVVSVNPAQTPGSNANGTKHLVDSLAPVPVRGGADEEAISLPARGSQSNDVGRAIPLNHSDPGMFSGGPNLDPPIPLDGSLPPPTQSLVVARVPNIIVFGETGVGKSSLINMLAGEEIAGVSNQALGYTFESASYPVKIGGEHYKIWDTAGLNEGEHGNVPAEKAVQNLFQLINGLEGRVELLVYCIRGGRYRDIWYINYELFHSIIFEQKVPIVLVITGLENETPMESWWEENAQTLKMKGMQFDGHICITTTKGKKTKSGEHIFADEYNECEGEVRTLIRNSWRPMAGEATQLDSLSRKLSEYYNRDTAAVHLPVVGSLRQARNMRESVASFIGEVAHVLKQLLRWLEMDVGSRDLPRDSQFDTV